MDKLKIDVPASHPDQTWVYNSIGSGIVRTRDGGELLLHARHDTWKLETRYRLASAAVELTPAQMRTLAAALTLAAAHAERVAQAAEPSEVAA